mmetsp:Transcript_19800/g.29433  ORF Transcript_19800/g.29433 Transcript_19800/m.29433 type:complete len:514 (-) Transcript_19800:174-1715(-)|eukprot:CAMPEP_0116025062 /NCGR_PEP_ID=MMETSP0321-20121206/12764_1 /TAXON_ID=163516 /ORGANISM="Leptocylindrus danicus var. danicus, Strain B650" /LENGTH=513 /DNA_ID=CAMNT_0003497063 /DNA_START=54 /DNA_END=1595 /DNA_ORIENTATION=-
MSFVFAASSRSNPWLMSDDFAISRSERERQDIVNTILQKCPFPGTAADHTKKIRWTKGITELVYAEMEESFFMSPCPEDTELVNEVFLKYAPETLKVRIRVPKSDLKIMVDSSPIDRDDDSDQRFEEAFSSSSLSADAKASKSKLNAVYTIPQSGATWKDYAAWLTTTQCQDDRDQIELGTRDCNNNDTLYDELCAFMNDLGFRHYMERVELAHGSLFGEVHHSTITFSYLEKKVGENRYFPCPDDNNNIDTDDAETGGVCVSILIHLKKPSEDTMRVAKTNAAFLAHLKKMMEESKKLNRDTCGYYKILKKENENGDADYDSEEEEDDEPPPLMYSNDTVHVLWLPLEYPNEHKRCFGHFLRGEGESRSIQKRLEKGNTDTGNITISIFESELAYMKKRGRTLREKFATALSLTEASTYGYMSYAHDNEFPEELAKCVSTLATFWRTNLLKMTDDELGIGDGSAVPEGALSPSREALYTILHNSAKRFEEMSDYGVPIKFNWKPGKSRKRKS